MELKEEYNNLSIDELRTKIEQYFQVIKQDDSKQIHIKDGMTLTEWVNNMNLLMNQEFKKSMGQIDKESFREHTLAARATLYPGKTYEEVSEIVDKIIESWV